MKPSDAIALSPREYTTTDAWVMGADTMSLECSCHHHINNDPATLGTDRRTRVRRGVAPALLPVPCVVRARARVELMFVRVHSRFWWVGACCASPPQSSSQSPPGFVEFRLGCEFFEWK